MDNSTYFDLSVNKTSGGRHAQAALISEGGWAS